MMCSIQVNRFDIDFCRFVALARRGAAALKLRRPKESISDYKLAVSISNCDGDATFMREREIVVADLARMQHGIHF